MRKLIIFFRNLNRLWLLMALAVVLDVDVFTRAEIAFVVGGSIAVVWMSLASLVSLRDLMSKHEAGEA